MSAKCMKAWLSDFLALKHFPKYDVYYKVSYAKMIKLTNNQN